MYAVHSCMLNNFNDLEKIRHSSAIPEKTNPLSDDLEWISMNLLGSIYELEKFAKDAGRTREFERLVAVREQIVREGCHCFLYDYDL